jgi:Holliday junction resolvase
MKEFNREKFPYTLPDDKRGFIYFIIPGEMVGQGRPRATTINGHARMYEPQKSVNYQNLVKMLATEKMEGRPPFIGQIEIDITPKKAIPDSYPKWLKEMLLAEGSQAQPMCKPDNDNIEKAIMDGMNKIVYRDDTQVTVNHTSKRFGEKNEVFVTVWYNKTLNDWVAEKRKGEKANGKHDN